MSGRSRHSLHRDQAGLTAIELAVVLVIVALLAAAAYPMLGTILDAMAAKGASEQVASAIRLARQFAITSGENRCVEFGPTGGGPKTQYRIRPANDTGCTGTALDGYEWTNLSHTQSAATTAVVVVFNPVGNRLVPTGSGNSVFSVYLDVTPITCVNTITVTLYGGVRVQQASC
jgi:prepilin-type N-terminal cleavage/methylation domain-containing protein